MKPAFLLIPRFLLRAPLLPLSALAQPGAALRKHPLGMQAIALASPTLARALDKKAAASSAALARYGRRAAFRPTPHGLLAGVAMGTLGARTAIDTAEATAHLTWSWAALAAAGRALLDDPEVRAGVRLRVAPSLLLDAGEATWLLLPADPDAPLEVRRWEADPMLEAMLDALADWTPWSAARAAAAASLAAVEQEEGGEETPEGGLDDEAIDEYLFLLLEQGMLHCDLSPPLVGRPPLEWMRTRLTALADTDAVRKLTRALAGSPPAAHATLLLGGTAVIQQAVAARAAALAPLLFRLQEGLAPPVFERALDRSLRERLDGLAEIYGAGGFSCAALATGSYGDALAATDEGPVAPAAPDVALLAILAEALTEAARAGNDTIDLDSAALAGVLGDGACPPSFELILSPARSPRGSAPGTDWLLGLHAPAGATWGRFAHALGAPMSDALAALASTEAPSLDVSFAPSAKLADLCVHPPARASALALVSWPEGAAVAPRDLNLAVEPPSLSLRDGDGRPVVPSPLHRVRSTTAPAGIFRLLAGWSFARQHAPWAFAWGPFADLPRLPRARIDGFVVAPASWRIPPKDALAGKAFARWRRELQVPTRLQVGEGDELLFVDLDAPEAAADLAAHEGARAFEIWPPLDAPVDAGGRRVEAVIAVVTTPEPLTARAAAGFVSPHAAPHWLTYKLFGREERQDDVLLGAVAPLVNDGPAEHAIDRWFFQRYIDGPGRRDHLRLRVHVEGSRAAELFDHRLRAAIAPLRAAGQIAAVETAEYFPEISRYGGPATFAVVERLFGCDSQLVLDLLGAAAASDEPPAADRVDWLVRSFDALTDGLGLELAARRALAAQRRAVVNPPSLDAEFRLRQRSLAALVGGTTQDAFSAAFAEHRQRVRAVVAALSSDARAKVIDVLPALLHVCAVRLVGARPADEAVAYVFWERTLEGLAARRRR